MRHDGHMAEPIFHITEPALWERAVANGSYTGSTRGAELRDVGYMHASFRHQVEAVANRFYSDVTDDLLLLQVDPDRVPSDIRVENLDGGPESFPHIYGELPTNAVTAVHHLVREFDRWKLPRTV
jgi:uncharacterized protein (DUF952 family)